MVVGACVAHLLSSPLLPTLWGDWRSLPVAVVALVPLVWLSVIDHLVASPLDMRRRWSHRPAAGPGRLLWRARSRAGPSGLAICAGSVFRRPVRGRVGSLARDRGLDAGAHGGRIGSGLLVLGTKLAAAARSRRPWWWQHLLAALLAAMAISEFLRRAVLQTISVPPLPAATSAVMAGISLAALGAGLAVRRPLRRLADAPKRRLHHQRSLKMGRASGCPAGPAMADVVPPGPAGPVGLGLRWSASPRRLRKRPRPRPRHAPGPRREVYRTRRSSPCSRLSLRWRFSSRSLTPPCAWRRGRATGESNLRRHLSSMPPPFQCSGTRPSTRRQTGIRRGVPTGFLQARAAGTGDPLSIPDMEFPTTPSHAVGRQPDIYLFVIDSLRRDYLSPYNHAVTFTPNIEAYSHESFVFRNAFTRHGATQLAAPSIWAGAAVVRGVLAPGFERLNAIEAFVNAEGYRIAINDFTVASYCGRRPPRRSSTRESLASTPTSAATSTRSSRTWTGPRSDSRPVFAYLSPMNLHILRTRGGGGRDSAGNARGSYPPYVSALRRIDACFGEFVSALKKRDRYDNSIIVLTSDHGDSLGENGYWGHATWLFPEVVRVPLVVHVPESLRETVTTDLSRLAFTADLVPTLYALRGHRLDHIGQPYGAPLFVPRTCVLGDDRRRGSFLLTSSYGAAFGLLRRNGRQLYVTDLVERREFEYDLTRGRSVARSRCRRRCGG